MDASNLIYGLTKFLGIAIAILHLITYCIIISYVTAISYLISHIIKTTNCLLFISSLTFYTCFTIFAILDSPSEY